MAYEWEFNGYDNYQRMHGIRDEKTGERKMVPLTGIQSAEQRKMSDELKILFPAYVNGLHLKDEKGNCLKLEEDGNGSFKEYVKARVMESIQRAMEEGTDFPVSHGLLSGKGKLWMWILNSMWRTAQG